MRKRFAFELTNSQSFYFLVQFEFSNFVRKYPDGNRN